MRESIEVIKRLWTEDGPFEHNGKFWQFKVPEPTRIELDNGVVIVAKWLSDAGYEVVYLGFYNFPEHFIEVALQEDVDAIGVSFLGGEHLYYTRKLTDLMKEKGINNIKLILGGVIPSHDVDELKNWI